MRAALITIIISALLVGCSGNSAENEIVGLWRAVLDEKQLLEAGMKKEAIEKSATEMKFNSNGTVEIRIIDPVNFSINKANELVGIYKIKNNRMKISLKKGTWENQKLTINGNTMSLEPIEYKGEIVNKFVRIKEWSLKNDT